VVVPPEMIETISVLKEACDLNVATLSQAILAAMVLNEDLSAHLERLRIEYKARRDAMSEALEAQFGPTVRWVKPSAGFYFGNYILDSLIELPPRVEHGNVFTGRFVAAFSTGSSCPKGITAAS
jgi:DNA-binding transcriptional MocR family regulator